MSGEKDNINLDEKIISNTNYITTKHYSSVKPHQQNSPKKITPIAIANEAISSEFRKFYLIDSIVIKSNYYE